MTYPIDAREVKSALQSFAPKEILGAISKIRFGCNQTTTQEARIVGRGPTYEIRINFFLCGSKTRLLSQTKKWLKPVETCGGDVIKGASEVYWSANAARRYAIFLLFHEVGHAVYARERGLGMLHSSVTSAEEERWCDSFGLQAASAFRGEPS